MKSAKLLLALAATLLATTGMTRLAAVTLPTLFGSAGSTFVSINPSTGAGTALGVIGFNQVGGMDFNPSTGILFAAGRNPIGGALTLLTINPATGAGTAVGVISGTSGANVTDISFRSDGVLFGANGSNQAFTLNVTTGAASLLGAIGGGSFGNALAFSPGDTLFFANSDLETINQSTGVGTTVVGLTYPGLTNSPRANGMDFDPVTGALYASVQTQGDGSSPGSSRLVTINPVTGVATNIGTTFNNLDALTVAPVAAIPEPSTTAVLAGLAGLGLAAGWRSRRAKHRVE